MQEIIYFADNYRGFQKTKISLSNVNFLVGENSTGKTSIIYLIALLNDFKFSLNLDFDLNDNIIGTFDDILSKNTSEKFFTIGVFSKIKDKEDKEYKIFGTLLRFVDDDGLPKLLDNIIYIDDLIISIRFNSEILYRYKQIDNFKIGRKLNKIVDMYIDFEESKKFRSINFKTYGNNKRSKQPPLFMANLILEKEKCLINYKNKFKFIFPVQYEQFTVFAPIRSKPKQVYLGSKKTFSPEGDHIPYMFKTICEFTKSNTEFFDAINDFGKESGLYDELKIVSFGSKRTAPFELDIIKNNKNYSISSVSYGVSQIFPIIIDMIARTNNSVFAIQQPEVHLHPRAQASYGNLLFQTALKDNKKFIIETHSDFIIDRFRHSLSKSKEKLDSKILFFINQDGNNFIKEIKIHTDGTYPNNQPTEFRKFFINESLKLLEI